MEPWQEKLQSMLGSMPTQPEQRTPEKETSTPAKKETLEIVYERKGRGGKAVTIICGFECSAGELAAIASELKKSLATGGSADSGEILIQGDRRAQAADILRRKGYKVKGA